MQNQEPSRIRNWLGGALQLAAWSLFYDDECRVVPLWAKLLLVPSLLLLSLWAYWPLLRKELGIMQGAAERSTSRELVGIEREPCSTSRIWAGVIFCAIAAPMIMAVFLSGYSLRSGFAASDRQTLRDSQAENGRLKSENAEIKKQRNEYAITILRLTLRDAADRDYQQSCKDLSGDGRSDEWIAISAAIALLQTHASREVKTEQELVKWQIQFDEIRSVLFEHVGSYIYKKNDAWDILSGTSAPAATELKQFDNSFSAEHNRSLNHIATAVDGLQTILNEL